MKEIIKTMLLLTSIGATTIASGSPVRFTTPMLEPEDIRIEVIGEIGVPRRACRGLGLGCLVQGVRVIVLGGAERTAQPPMILERIGNTQLRLFFSVPDEVNPEKEPFVIEKDIQMDAETAKAIGFSNVILRAGSFKPLLDLRKGWYVDLPIIGK